MKIIQASKIAAMSYRTSVIREMAVLQLLSHPGVARLVSAFRYSDSAYMVLEYAARGDLHSYLIKHGSLEHKYTRYNAFLFYFLFFAPFLRKPYDLLFLHHDN